MGENFSTTISTLQDNPELRLETIKLIEDAFNYSSQYSFATDFYPLMSIKNATHNHIIVDKGKVVAHIGCLIKQLSGQHPVVFIGGIAVAPSYRGKGLFSTLLQHVLRKYEDKVSLFLLWSDKSELYQKFNFSLAIGQISPTNNQPIPPNGIKGFERKKLHTLSTEELQEVKDLYNAMAIHYTLTERDDSTWQELLQITSTDVFIQKDEDHSIQAYFLYEKGFDLQNIIHEVAYLPSLKNNILKKLTKYNLWLPETEASYYDSPLITYMALIKIGSINLFSHLIQDWSNEYLKIQQITKDNIIFTFKESEFSASHTEFFQYLWGPYPLVEFEDIGLPIYIPGLDSI